MTPSNALAKALFACTTTMALTAQGAGFYLSEVGTPGSLGTAGVANPTNTWGADAAWANPAGMSYLDEQHLIAGLQVLVPKIEFNSKSVEDTVTGRPVSGNDGGNAGEAAIIPSFFYVKPLSERARFGFSVTGPLGGGIDYGSDFVGRYAIDNVFLAGVGFTPSVSYKVNDRLSLGAGVSAIYTIMEQEIAVRQPGTTDASAKFEDLDDWGFQGVLGLTYEISDRLLLGAVYRSEADVDLEGKIKVKNLQLPVTPPSRVRIGWTNPQWFEAGLRYSLSDDTQLFFNAGWQEWSTFSENRIGVDSGRVVVLDRNWDDTWHAGIALAHRMGSQSQFSLGLSYDSSPVKDKYRTLDFPLDEMWKFSASYGWERKENLKFAVGGTLALIGDAPLDQTAQGVRVIGDYDSNWMAIVGGTVYYAF